MSRWCAATGTSSSRVTSRSGEVLRTTTTSPALVGLALVLCLATGCIQEGVIVPPGGAPAGAARIEVQFDPARRSPSNCTDVWFSYQAHRTGNTAGAPDGDVSFGDTSADDAWSQQCPSQETFTFTDRFEIKQGMWDFSLRVTLDS